VISEHPDPHMPEDPLIRVDYIYYRGPYKVSWTEMRETQLSRNSSYAVP